MIEDAAIAFMDIIRLWPLLCLLSGFGLGFLEDTIYDSFIKSAALGFSMTFIVLFWTLLTIRTFHLTLVGGMI